MEGQEPHYDPIFHRRQRTSGDMLKDDVYRKLEQLHGKHQEAILAADGKTPLKRYFVCAVIYARSAEDAERRVKDHVDVEDAEVLV